MLYNYSMLKGIISKDLEDSIKRVRTHYNLLVNANNLEYQINIDVQSYNTPNVKILIIEKFSNSLLDRLEELENYGLFQLNTLPKSYHLDYIRSNIFSIENLKNTKPKSWEEISNILDQYIKPGKKIYCLGEYYDNNQEREGIPHGLMLRQIYTQLPPRGIHDIHMNQGVPLTMRQNKSNGIYQDGAIFIPDTNNTVALFFMFSSQSLKTDQAGNPV